MASVSDNIKAVRKSLKMTQKDLSLRSGVSQSAISDIESGNKSPSASTLSMIADGLGVSMVELLSEEGVQKKPATEGELDEVLAGWMRDLTPQELQRLFDFAEGLKAARKS